MKYSLLLDKYKELIKINSYYLRVNYSLYKNNYSGYDEKFYGNFLKSYVPCFVLSTGRCGTGLLTKITAKSKQSEVFHSNFLLPNPLLKIFQNKYFSNSIDNVNIFEACRS